MVFRRSYRTRRRPMGRRRRSNRRSRRRPMTASRVKRIINAELKYAVQALDATIPATTGIIVPLTSGIAIGDLQTSRTGNWISPQNYHGNLVVKGNLNAMVATDSFLIRAGIFQWMNDEQFDPPDLAQIVHDPLAPLGPLSLLNKGSFKQVWGRTFVIMNDDDNSQFIKKFHFYLRLGRRPKSLYDAGNPKKFQYYFFIHTDSIVTDNPFFSLDSVLRYTDS